MNNIGRLERGDKVDVLYGRHSRVRAEIIYTPAGAGDLWGYKTEDGVIFYPNPYSSDFVGFELIDETRRLRNDYR